MLCFVGLGNPGRGYHDTRHNIGWRVLDTLAQRHALTWRTVESRTAAIAEWGTGPDRVLLIKPQQFMNRSGGPVARLKTKYRLPSDRLWVVVDDIDLPFGQIRLRPNGSSGGHHGLDSIIERLGPNFPRLRLGVGPKKKAADFDGATYVLNTFTPAERKALPDFVERAIDALALGAERGLGAAMNVWNRPAASRRRP